VSLERLVLQGLPFIVVLDLSNFLFFFPIWLSFAGVSVSLTWQRLATGFPPCTFWDSFGSLSPVNFDCHGLPDFLGTPLIFFFFPCPPPASPPSPGSQNCLCFFPFWQPFFLTKGLSSLLTSFPFYRANPPFTVFLPMSDLSNFQSFFFWRISGRGSLLVRG